MLLQHGQNWLRQLTRSIYTTCAQCQLSHYDALGIAKSSTQNEIKAAYYKLSMIYHPDRNQGSDSAAKKFREITQAYEILGNYRLRRLYDKGIVHTAGAQYSQDIQDMAEEIEDDAETKFYKSRFKKSKVADNTGRTPIYDFDEWSRAHYGKSFDRNQAARQKFDRIKKQKEHSAVTMQNDIVMFALLFMGMAMYLMFISESSYDTPKAKALAKHAEQAKLKEQQAATSSDV